MPDTDPTAAPTLEIWITKYACSKGILHAVRKTDRSGRPLIGWLGLRRDHYALTEDDARVAAQWVLEKKIESLRRQLAKLEGIDFATARIKEFKP